MVTIHVSLTCLKGEGKYVDLNIFHCVISEPLKLAVSINYVIFKVGNSISDLHILVMKAVF